MIGLGEMTRLEYNSILYLPTYRRGPRTVIRLAAEK